MKLILVFVLLTISFSTLANGFIVKLKKGTKDNFLFNKAIKDYGDYQPIEVSFGDYIYFKPNKGIQNKAIEILKLDSNVEYIEPNYIYTIDPIKATDNETEYVPGDDLFPKQWGLRNDGWNSAWLWIFPGTAGEDINALEAWKIHRGSEDIKIAVIDTGIDYNHQDLKDNLYVNSLELDGEKGVDDDQNGYVDDIYGYDFANKDADPMDGHGHGTHCAGVIGATHNGTGIVGIMEKVKIVGIKFLTDSGRGELKDAVLAIDYAIKAGVKIMSNSWGGDERSEALKEAIEAAERAGVLFVAASGNSYRDNDSRPTYPANYKVNNVISVGAIDGKGNKASFSNYGKTSVHVFAPGWDILSTVKGNNFQKMSGTSMAAPHASGVLGLLFSYDPAITYQEAKERLINTSKETAALSDVSVSKGRIDAYRVLEDIRD